MANDLTVNGNRAVGNLPIWAKSATADTWPGELESVKALACLDEDRRGEIKAMVALARLRLEPMDEKSRKQRLTALGMVMSPNRAPAEASMWLHELSRLLSDLPADILCHSIDTLQCRLKFLPTVAEIREIADPLMDERRREHGRLDAMRRYLESGQPVALPPPPRRDPMQRRGERMSEDECNELNGILANLGAVTRYRPDGSRYDVEERKPERQEFDRPQNPTREDYISWGVDPATLDRIEAEKMTKNSTTSIP